MFSPLIALLTVWAVLKQNENVSPSDIIETAKSADKLLLSAAGVCAFMYVWFEGAAVRTIAKSTGYKRSRASGLIYAASDVYFSAITPSATGGQPASAYFMVKDGIPAGVSAAVLVLNLMMYTVSVVVLGVIAVVTDPHAFSAFSSPSKLLIVCGAVVLTMLSAAFLLLLLKGKYVFAVLRRLAGAMKLSRLTEKIDRAEKDYSSCAVMLAKDRSLLLRAFVWNFLQRASQIVVPMVLYLALGGEGRYAGTMFSRQCLITIGYNFVPIPGAMGITDYLMIDGFSGVVGSDAAFSLEMLSRGLTFYICVTVSGIITMIGYIAKRTARYENAEEKDK